MSEGFYEENLDRAILARDEIIARFQEWWSEDEIIAILADPNICSPAFLPNMQAMAEMGYVKQLDHKECARILYEQVGEKFLIDQNTVKRDKFFIKILRANSEKKEEINELLDGMFNNIVLEDIPEHSSDELYDYLAGDKFTIPPKPRRYKKHLTFLGKLIDIIGLPLDCAQNRPKGPDDWTSQLVEPLAPVGALYDFQRDISRQIHRMLKEYSDKTSRAMIPLPTGSGKTRVVVESVIDWINDGKPGQPEKRFIVWLVERKELCQQAFDTFRTIFLSKGKHDTSLELLVYWGNKSKNLAKKLRDDDDDGAENAKTTIIIASRASLSSIVDKNGKLPEEDQYLKKLVPKLAVVIIDEAHGWMSKTSTEVLHSLGFNFMSAARGGKPHPNNARLLGMTATPFKNIKLVDSSASNEANVKRIVKDETEKLQSRFGGPDNFIWPDANSSISRHRANPPHAIIELQQYATVGNDVLMSATRSFDQDGRIEGYYWQVKIIKQGGGSTYKYDTGKKNGLTGDPVENVRKWRNSPALKLNEEKEKWASKDVFDEPGQYDVFLWVKDDDGLCNQEGDVRRINVTIPETKGEQDAQIRMREILKNLKEQKVLASPKRWIINHDLSHLNLKFKTSELKGRKLQMNELDEDSMRAISADTEFNRKIIHVLKKLIHEEKRKSILVFANTVEHAKLLSCMIRSAITEDEKPVTSEFVYADTHVDERCRFIKEFREQKLRVLCNYDILTQGFDAPKVDAIVVARDTGSYVLHTQMIGRGLRGPKNGGTEECRIVDFSNKIRQQQSMLSEEQRLDGWQFHKDLYDDDVVLSDFELGFKKIDDMKWPDSSYEVAYNVWKKGNELSVREKQNLFRLFTENPEYQEWQPKFWEYIKEIHEKLQEELFKSFSDEPAMTGLDLKAYDASPDKKSFDDLIDFIDNIMQMEATYQPVMIKFLLTQQYYTATRRQIAGELHSKDLHQDHTKDYTKVSVYPVLTDHHIVNITQRPMFGEDQFTLNVVGLTPRQEEILDGKLEIAITKFVNKHRPETTLRTESQGKIVLPDNSEILFESNPKAIGRDDFSKYFQLHGQNENTRKISRVQFTISQESGHCYIEDGVTSVQEKSSSNGTKVNGQDITDQGRKELENDDVIELSRMLTVTFQSTTKTDQKKTTEKEELEEKYAKNTSPNKLKEAIYEYRCGDCQHLEVDMIGMKLHQEQKGHSSPATKIEKD